MRQEMLFYLVAFLLFVLFTAGCVAKKPTPKIAAYDFSHVEERLLSRGFYVNASEMHQTTSADTELQFKGITKTAQWIYLPQDKKVTKETFDQEKVIYEQWFFKEKQQCLDELTLQQTEWCNQKKAWNDCEILPGLLIIKEKSGLFTKVFWCNTSVFSYLFSQHNASWMIPLIQKK